MSRRLFLKGTGGFTLAIPLLPSLLPRETWAQNITPVKRYFNLVGGYDYGHHQNWFPTLNQLSTVHTPANGDQVFRYQRLSSFLSSPTQDLSVILGNRLNPYVNKMNIFRGLNLHTRIGHGSGHMLGNIAASDGHDTQVTSLRRLPTIDQVLAASRNFNPNARTPLILSTGSTYSYARDGAGNVTRASGRWAEPHELFQSLFNVNGMPIPENGGSTTSQHPRRDVLSRVMEDYRTVRGGRNISTADRQILDTALDRISDIQARMGVTVTAAGCRYSAIDTTRSRNDGIAAGSYNTLNHGYAFELYALIFAAAASCDLNRVFGLHLSIPDNPFDRNNSEDFHQGHSHRPWDVIAENNNRVNHRYMGDIWRTHVDNFLAPLVASLDSQPDIGGTTLLDNSLVHMTLESSVVHSDANKPCLMIGRAGGALNTGYMIDYSRRELGPAEMQGDNFNNNPSSPQFGHSYHGLHYNRSLTTILRAMGLSPAEYEDPTINTFFQGRSDSLLGAQNNGVTRVGGYGHIGSQQSGVWYYSNAQLYSQEYARQNYHFYKESLPLPPGSAT